LVLGGGGYLLVKYISLVSQTRLDCKHVDIILTYQHVSGETQAKGKKSRSDSSIRKEYYVKWTGKAQPLRDKRLDIYFFPRLLSCLKLLGE